VKKILPSDSVIGMTKVMQFLSMVGMVGKVSLIHSQLVAAVLEPSWLLAGPGSDEVAQIQVECHFASYYCPFLATCAFVLRSNLTAQASGKVRMDVNHE